MLRRLPARDGGSPGRPRPVRRHGRSEARDEAEGGPEAAEGLKVAGRPLGLAVSSVAVPPCGVPLMTVVSLVNRWSVAVKETERSVPGLFESHGNHGG